METRPSLTVTLTQLLEPSLPTTDNNNNHTHGFPVLVIRHSERIDESHPEAWKRIVAQATKNPTTTDDRDHYSFSHDPPLSEPNGILIAEEVAMTVANALRSLMIQSEQTTTVEPVDTQPPSTHTTHTTHTLPPIVTPSKPPPPIRRQHQRQLQVHLYCSRTRRTVQTAIAIARRLTTVTTATTVAASHPPSPPPAPVIILSRGLSRILTCVQKRDQCKPLFQFVPVSTWQAQYPDIHFIDGEAAPPTSSSAAAGGFPLPLPSSRKATVTTASSSASTAAALLPWRATWRHILRHHHRHHHDHHQHGLPTTSDQPPWVLPIIVGHRETIRHLHADTKAAQRLATLPYCAVAVFHVTRPVTVTANDDVTATAAVAAAAAVEAVLTPAMVASCTVTNSSPNATATVIATAATSTLPPLVPCAQPSSTSHAGPVTVTAKSTGTTPSRRISLSAKRTDTTAATTMVKAAPSAPATASTTTGASRRQSRSATVSVSRGSEKATPTATKARRPSGSSPTMATATTTAAAKSATNDTNNDNDGDTEEVGDGGGDNDDDETLRWQLWALYDRDGRWLYSHVG